jgi:ubiquinone/menaquinone biosynthesis C-methylase UbiE
MRRGVGRCFDGHMGRLLALTYDRLMARGERAGLADLRARLLADANGRVLEVGAGTGLNLSRYPDAVTELTLTEPDASMLHRLERTVSRSGRPATVLRAAAEDLPFEDATFDTVVSTLVLCGVDDQPRAVREIHRVLKRDGRLLLLEHVRDLDARRARRQDRLNWFNRLVAGCECNRPTLGTIDRGGFTIDHVAWGELPKAPPFLRPMIVGGAVVRSAAPRPA